MERYSLPPTFQPANPSRVPVRQDGRPEAYHLKEGFEAICIACAADMPPKTIPYPRGEVFMVNPHNNPTNSGVECFLCKEHLRIFLPDVVIVDPLTWDERDLRGRKV